MKPAITLNMPSGSWPRCFAAAGLLLAMGLAGCGKTGPAGEAGSDGKTIVNGVTTITTLSAVDNAPGVVLNITGVSGGTGSGGAFKVGDKPAVTFTIKKSNGDAWLLSEMGSGRILISGPTEKYQRVLPRANDLVTRSVVNADGSYTYTFASGFPSTYAAPDYEDTTNEFNLKGQPLGDGTYTIGMMAAWNYTVEGVAKRDVGNATKDVVFGVATLSPREVVKTDNCNSCHVQVIGHGGSYKDVKMCVLCHTAGTQDKDKLVSVEFKVMLHKIHDGFNLPSVQGVGTNSDGSRDYTKLPGTYAIGTSDFSEVKFPVFPAYNIAMPKELGYSALSTTVGTGQVNAPKTKNDNIRKAGASACYKCHDDADGTAGPKTAPAQGNLAYTPTRRACGSCHDDIDWTKPYAKNGMIMLPQANDVACLTCHTPTGTTGVVMSGANGSGTLMPTSLAHVHPASDPKLVPEVTNYTSQLNIAATLSNPTHPAATYFVAGDKPAVTFTVKNDSNVNVPLYKLGGTTAAIAGPNNNRQLIFPMKDTRSNTYSFCDFSGRAPAAATNTGTGTMSRVAGSPVSETLQILFSAAGTFDVTAGEAKTVRGSGLTLTHTTNPNTKAKFSEIEIDGSVAAQELAIAFTTTAGVTTFTVSSGGSQIGSTGTLATPASAVTRWSMPDQSIAFTITTTADPNGFTYYMTIAKAATGFTSGSHTFAIVPGTTAFAANDRFYYETVQNDLTSYTYQVPMEFYLETLGLSTATTLAAGNLPVYWGREDVYEAVPSATVTATTTGSNNVLGRYVTVNAVGSFANGNFVVLDRGAANQECLKIGSIVGTQFWFTTPLRFSHGAVSVEKLALTAKREGVDYSLTSATGVVVPVSGKFAAGSLVLMNYRTDGAFGWYRRAGDTRQDYYPVTLNDTTALGQDWGKWQTLPFQSGTYDVSLWGYLPVYLARYNETQTYRATSRVAKCDFSFGSAGTVTPYNLISSETNCDNCHGTLSFHGGGRKGHDACTMCHGITGFEDTPWYTTGASTTTDSTPNMSWNFRSVIHKAHMGAELANASTYGVPAGAYADVEFPAMPGGAKACETCHGTTNTAWKAVADRSHINETTGAIDQAPMHNYTIACGSCHDSDTATAHISAMTLGTATVNSSGTTTPAGTESCEACHGAGAAFAPDIVHKNR